MKRKAFLSIDGLSAEDARHLSRKMPFMKGFFEENSVVTLISGGLSSTHAIWGELLTGTSWLENGCVAYAAPGQSLNDLEVVSEKDLHAKARLAPDSDKTIVVNVPLLLPQSRLWLSDGSIPFTPTASANTKTFLNAPYKPRPYTNVAVALSNRYHCIDQVLECDKTRMSTALLLTKSKDWKDIIIRLSAFDQIQHLFGADAFIDSKLRISGLVSSYLESVDNFARNLSEQAELSILSTFSHTVCNARFNLNRLLEQGNFLNTSESGSGHRASTHRIDAFEAATSVRTTRALLSTSEGRVNSLKTLASSPVQNCVYVNSAARFPEGSVNTNELEKVRQKLHKYLAVKVADILGVKATIIDTKAAVGLPDFVVTADGVEFCDSLETYVDFRNKPMSTHTARGFISSPNAKGQETMSVSEVALLS